MTDIENELLQLFDNDAAARAMIQSSAELCSRENACKVVAIQLSNKPTGKSTRQVLESRLRSLKKVVDVSAFECEFDANVKDFWLYGNMYIFHKYVWGAFEW